MIKIGIAVVACAFAMFLAFTVVSGGRVQSTDESMVHQNAEEAAAKLSEPVK